MRSLKFRLLSFVSAAVLSSASLPAFANPLGGQVVAGSATIRGETTSTVVVNQSTEKGIIDWNTFNLGAGDTTRFVQPDAAAVTLNRVTGGMGASTINGMIGANGGVYVVNPDGMLFGPNAVINTNSFLGTTSDIANSDFMAGTLNFGIPGNPSASIVNEGKITAANGGFAALVAPGVRNDGIITANLGTVGLSSANTFTLDLYGDNLINLQPSDSVAAEVRDVATGQTLQSLVQNTGTLRANGGRVALTAVAARQVLDSVINTSGVVEANTVGTHKGQVIFGAATGSSKPAGAPRQVVRVSGRVSAAGHRRGTAGGRIQVTGEAIQLAGATLDASGQTGGGTIIVGGLKSGALPQAQSVTLDGASAVHADATTTGNGGEITLWSTGTTSVEGLLTAIGGANGGNGGTVETSGEAVAFSGLTVNTSAPLGAAGTWLIDPTDLTVDGAAAYTISSNLASTNVTLQTTATTASGLGTQSSGLGDIDVDAPISWSSAHTLTLSAYNGINIVSSITATGNGALVLGTNNQVGGANSSGSLNFFSGNIELLGAGAALTINSTPYTLIQSVAELLNVNSNLSGNYALAKPLDLGGTTYPDVVIANDTSGGFLGTFNGLGNTISNLTIVSNTSTVVGLFGQVGDGFTSNTAGTVENIGLIGGSVTSNTSSIYLGALVGQNTGTIINAYATTAVTDTATFGAVGGLVGYNWGVMSNVHASGNVTDTQASTWIGGLVGYNDGWVGGGVGTITNAYATGTVQGGTGVGGIETGGGAGSDTGGLVGINLGTISSVYSTGAVTAGSGTDIGGLIGENDTADGDVTFSDGYWDKTTSGISAVGTGAGTPETTSTLQDGVLPTGFSSTVWSAVSGKYPFLGPKIVTVALLPQTATYGTAFSLDQSSAEYTETEAGTTLSGGSFLTLSGISLTVVGTGSSSGTIASTGAAAYPIVAAGATASGYVIAYAAPVDLTVNPVPLTITANDQSKVYGAALPALTAGYSGFVNGDTAASLTTAPTLVTTATAASHASGNPYSITASGAVDPNYTISYVAGSLTVTKAPLTITADNQTKVYGAAIPTLTASYTGLVNGDVAASLTTSPTLITTATAASHVAGSPYSITASGAVDADYTISYVAGSLSVTSAPLTITADNQSSTYGGALPALTVSYSGFVNGDTAASLTTAATASVPATSASPAGSYTITASGAVDTDYALSYATGTLTIGQAALTITADNQSSTYGGALPALTVSYAGFVNGDTQASLTTAATASVPATSASPAGSYAITPSGAVDPNYAISYVDGTLTIGQAALTITADNQSKVYGAAIPVLTASFAGFVNGDTTASLSTQPTLTTTATAASHVAGSPYAVTASGAVDPNYTISYVPGSLSVTAAPLTITADNQTKVYGAALPTLTASYTGLVNGDIAANLTTQPTLTTTATAASHVAGSPYAITASGAVDADYTISYVAGSLSVTSAPLTIMADNQSSTYGGALPALTVSYSGFVNGDTAASLTTAATASVPATSASPAGSYTITASGAVDTDYALSYTTGTLTIGQAALTIAADNQSSTYGGALPALTVSYAGFVNGDTQASLTTAATASTPATSASPAGSYAITPSGAVDPNYALSYTTGTLTIGQAALTITADNQSKVYGAALPVLTASFAGFVNGDTAASLSTQPTLTTTATAASHVAGNPYAITASGAVDPNYTISYVPGSLSVTAAPLTITADNQSKVYGAALPTLTASYTGFVNGDIAANLTTQPTLTTTATAASHVAGSPYAITASGAVDADYTISYVAGSLSVTSAPLTIMADNQSSTYGGALPALTVSYSGFVNGDTAASLTTAATASVPATSASPAGSYTITASGAVDTDYALSYTTGTLTIGQAALTIAADNQSSTYGGALPALTVSYAGFVNGDTQASLTTAATASVPATSASPAGSYAITPSGAVDPNYAISYVDGTLTIGQAALTITADNQSKVYGAALPVLTASFAGFVNGDTAASLSTQPTLTTTATAASHVAGNPYAITASGAVDPNYTISYVAGSLSVTAAPLTITADNQSKVYGAALPTLTASYTGFVNGDIAANLTTQPTLTTTATAASHVAGSPYAITASGAVDADYTISYVAGSLSVTSAPLTVTADDKSSNLGSALPALTVSYSGFVNGDTAASLTTAATASVPATSASPAGPYTITPAGAVDADYTISYVDGTLTIAKATLTITAGDATSVYGAPLPPNGTITVSYSGFINGDTSSSLTVPPSVTDTAFIGAPAGNYALIPQGAVDPNYTIVYVNGTLTIVPAPLTITATSLSKVYGAALPGMTASYSGFVNGDTVASLAAQPTLTTTATAASHVSGSPYAITASGAADPNYAITYVAGDLTVTQAPLTIIADNQTKLYGAALPTLTASYTGLVNGDTAANLTTQPTLSTTATAASHVAGSPYAIAASGAVDPDYAISYVDGTLSITAAPLTITADNQNKVYGAALPTLTASYGGFVNGDTAANLTTQPTLSTTATAASHVAGNPYAIAANGAVDPDYAISYAPGSLTVTPAPLTVTADNQSSTYGQALPALTVSYSGFVNGDSQASLATAATASVPATSASPAGGYTITPSGALDADYAISYTDGTLLIGQAPLTITADDQTKVYGQALPALTLSYAGFVNGDTQANLTVAPTLSTTATSASHVGGYAIAASGAVDPNYAISYVDGTLSITPASLTITADNQTKVYGAALPTLTASYLGFVNGDTAANLTTQPTLTTTATAASHVAGSPYAITASGAVDADYTISYVAGSLSVTSAPLTITADNQSSTYGGALPALTVSYSGFVNGDTAASLTTAATASVPATSASPAGSYTITASGAVDTDYALSYATGTLTIGQAALTITPTAQSKTYGSTLVLDQTQFAELGLVNGDQITGLSLASAGTGAMASAGAYDITASGATGIGLTNYLISYAVGTNALTVDPAHITVTANSGSSVYGASSSNPGFTATGLQNGESVSVLAGLSNSFGITPASDVDLSPYILSVVGTLANPNYTVDQRNTGIWTVTPATLTYVADPASRMSGIANPTLTGTVTGFLLSDTLANATSGVLIFTSSASSATLPGHYAIVGSGLVADNDNYVFAQAAGNATALTVMPDTGLIENDWYLAHLSAPACYLGEGKHDLRTGRLVHRAFARSGGAQPVAFWSDDLPQCY